MFLLLLHKKHMFPRIPHIYFCKLKNITCSWRHNWNHIEESIIKKREITGGEGGLGVGRRKCDECVMGGDLTWGGKHAIQYTNDVL